MTTRFPLIACLAVFSLLVPSVRADRPTLAVGRTVPDFTLKDVEQKKRSLAEFRGRRVALFFFCSCYTCAEVAREWGPLQRGGALKGSCGKAPITLVIYEGEAEPLRALAAAAGLEAAQTILLPDPEKTVAAAYDAELCPRIFVLDAEGILRYTNSGKAPPSMAALTLVSEAVDALRGAADPKTLSAGKEAPPDRK